MPWPTWDEAAIATALTSLIAFVLFRRGVRVPINPAHPFAKRFQSGVLDFCQQFAIIAGLYSIWRLARQLPIAQEDGARRRAHDIYDFQQWLHMPSELEWQRWVIAHDWMANPINAYYTYVHVPALFVFLAWLFFRQREHFGRWRNALCLLTAFCLFVRFIRVAPPRFLPELGFIDLGTRYGISTYGSVGTGVSDQYAAMPSIHVAWAAVISFAVFATSTSKWRWFFLMHVFVTMFVVSVTGHHWWMDGIVAIALLALSLRIDTVGRRFLARRDGMTEPGNAEADLPTLRSDALSSDALSSDALSSTS